MTLKKFHNILYFNIYRFYRICFWWLGKPRYSFLNLNGLNGTSDRRHKNDNWDDDLIDDIQGGVFPFLPDKSMGALYACVIFILWNLVSSMLQFDFQSWKYGMYFLMVIAVLSIFAFNHEYLKDFTEFKSWSVNESRKFAIITLLTVSGIFFAFVGSSALYLSIAISNKP